MARDLSELKALLSAKALGADDEVLKALYETPVDIRFPSKIEIKGPADTKIFDLGLGDEFIFSLPVHKLLKDVAIPTARTVTQGLVKADFLGITFSVLEILSKIRERSAFLTKSQLAICRAILLVMDKKKFSVLTEKGASREELVEAMKAQIDEIPANLDNELSTLVHNNVLEIEDVTDKRYYKVVF